jgi:aromatic-L-amino-acid decarboxylase
LNQKFANLVEASDELSLVTKPSLALTVFRIVPKLQEEKQPLFSIDSLNDLNRVFFGRLSTRHDIMLTQTSLNGIFCVRFAVGAARTTEEHIQEAYNIIIKEAKFAFEAWEQTVYGLATVG